MIDSFRSEHVEEVKGKLIVRKQIQIFCYTCYFLAQQLYLSSQIKQMSKILKTLSQLLK
jgi:hypothetical protein